MNYRGFLIDENLKVPKTDIESFLNHTVYNSTEFFKEGTDDDHIIEWLKESKYVLVTSDIRMTVDALMVEVPVVYLNRRKHEVKFLDVIHHDMEEYKEIEEYCKKLFL